MNKKPQFSIVIPVFNKELDLEEFFKALKAKLNLKGEFEVIFVNDGSTDYSFEILRKIQDENDFVKVVKLAKNYGSNAAYSAGLSYAKGKAVILFGLDSKNSFESINSLVNKWLTGSKIVYGYRKNKTPHWWKIFKYKIMKSICKFFGIKDTLLPKADIELYDREVVDILNSLPDRHTYLRNTNCFIGYKISTFEYQPREASERGIAAYKQHKAEYAKRRKEEGYKRPKKLSYREHSFSRNISILLLAVGLALMVLGITFGVLEIMRLIGSAIVTVLGLGAFASGVLFFARSRLIKRLGKVWSEDSEKKPYEISEISGFN